MKNVIAAGLTALAALGIAAAPVQAAYPERPVQFVIPWPPGDLEDVLTRLIAKQFSKDYGVPAAVVNRAGGGGAFGYTASKWAVRGMTKAAAVALGPHNIRVNSIHPGLIETAMLHQLPNVEAGNLDQMVQRIPLGRIAEAEEVAKLALYLASDDSEYSTGSEFIVDGGMTA